MRCTECNRSVKPVVALDIDGTLADYHSHFFKFAQGWLGQEVDWNYTGANSIAEHLGIPKQQYRELKLGFRAGGMKRSMRPFVDASWLSAKLQDLGAEVWITTTRPYLRLDNVDPDTREWLRRWDIEYDGIIYDETKYVQLCEIVGVERVVAVVEDLPENIDEAKRLGLRTIQHGTPWNSAPQCLRTERVNSLTAAGNLVEQWINEWRETNVKESARLGASDNASV